MSATRSLVWIAGLAGLLAGASLAAHRRHERERRALATQPEPLQTWEGEGGAVPLRTGRTAQQVSPSRAIPGARDPQGATTQESSGGADCAQGGMPH